MRRLRGFLLLLALALVLPALGLGAASTGQAVLAYRAAFERRLEDTARALAQAVDREIAIYEATLTGLATARLLDAEATEADLDVFAERARAIAEALGSSIRLIGPPPEYRSLLHTALPPGVPLPSGLRLPPQEAPLPRVFATGRPALGGVARGAALDRDVAFLFVPVIRDGRVIRALGMALDPARLADVLRPQHLPEGALAAVTDSRGNVAARSRDHQRFVGTPAPAWYGPAMAGRGSGFLHGPTLEGEQAVLGFARVPSAPGWTVAVAESRAAYDASWQRPLLALALGGALVLALGMAMAMWLGHRLLRPLSALAADAEAVAAAAPGQAPPAPSAAPSSVVEFEALRRGFVAADAALRERAAAARAGEERLRLAVEGTGMATWDLDAATGRLVWSRHHFLMLGHDPDAPEEATIEMWRARVHPDDLPHLDAAWAEAERQGALFHVTYRIRRADDGSLRWMESYGRFIRPAAGEPGRFVGVMFDITERKADEERQRLLMREVDHRAKNALAVVQSVVRLTRAPDAISFAAAVEGRVRALARAHELLAADRWEGASLRDIAAEELAAHVEAGQVRLEGPSLRLRAEAVQPLSMVLHELATNAAKHGSLSRPGGTVTLVWRLDAASGMLHLCWTERQGPEIQGPPSRPGFGSRLVEATVRGQLGGSVALGWERSGLRCELTIPASRLAATEKPPDAAPRKAALSPADTAFLRGLRILVAEDEPLIATDAAETLRALGCEVVGPASTLPQALALAEGGGHLDAAVLDVNLGGQPSFPLATLLAGRGVPVVFATGYSELPEGSGGAGAAVLRKPVAPVELAAALRAAIGPAAA
ncbi:HWE histidine kinase domain-containing protein [Falsiroseomonas sp.]|uniref:HWE histidine kinase domain-containing protein n=1 Tax=Falsiroseomonas sp. TaxID=2870721 RepID=UPI003565C499